MANDFMEFLKESFENPNAMDLEAIRKMISETNKYLASLRSGLESEDPKIKEEALASAAEIQRFLESKASLFAPFMGAEPTDEERSILAEIQEGFNQSGRGKGKHLLKPKIKVS